MELIQARVVAKSKFEFLRPHCDLIEIAGSVRRSSPDVGDIEIVCVPKMIMAPNLFDKTLSRCPNFVVAVKSLGRIDKGDPISGKYIKIQLTEGISVDLFVTNKDDYYRQFAIRTGSADYSNNIAIAWRKKGWCGTVHGLRLEVECDGDRNEKTGKTVWTCKIPNPTLPPVWDSEREFFLWLGLKYFEPANRLK